MPKEVCRDEEARTIAAPADVRPAEVERKLVFLLNYDQEVTFLVHDGVLQKGMLPSGFKGK